ncbi:hypothetical protein JOE40_000772 [Arthrobacter sp. PvP102]|uniref:hypothetical protein n=1 Tax=unclassified Arthrobacter TaxID=235627 RepID=UPI001AE62B2C|nr:MULTISPECIES: hypothetical protein [unclassified Arthrobacter]MBP1235304.1 hypothetical protein [Arthrobacter sp. PvP103]MBP1236263.1 hypothetical protein [Arthrobacter sp. PvP102]
MTTAGHTIRAGRRGLTAASLAGTLTLALGAGTAYAYWTSTGTGTGSESAGTMQTVTVDAFISGDNPRSALIPGGTADVILRVTNPNLYTVQVYSVSPNGPATADDAHPGCTTTGVTFAGTGTPLTPATFVPPNSTVLISLPATAAMDSTSQSACQDATFHLPVTMAVRK